MKEKEFDDLVPQRNREAEQRHRREVFLQITLPMAVLLLATAAFCTLTVRTSTAPEMTGLWRDISLIWMLLLGLIASLIPLVILAGLAYGVIALIRVLPVYTYKIQKAVVSVSEAAHKVSDAAARPVVSLGSFFAGLRRLFSRK